jgi:multidrug efflux system membrane fusion protein
MRDITELTETIRETAKPANETPRRRSHAGLKLAGILALVVAIAVAAFGILQRRETDQKLAHWTDEQAVPSVAIIRPQPETKIQPVVLPGDVNAWIEAPIYARVSGYLKNWYKDIGARVKTGDLLGEIDTPDLDQQLIQARQDLNTTVANENFAVATAKRWKALLSSTSVSQQTVDEKVADALAEQAKVAASQANVGRLEALESFKRLVAPFDGVVTARRTDIGALINAGSATGPELFAVADIHKMRIYVRVPQSLSAQITVGMQATLSLPQYPDRTFPATVLTTSNAISTESRTVLVELVADNSDGKLWPGTFANVSFDMPADTKLVQIPASALLFQSEGLQVAILGRDNKVQIRSVRIGRNFGSSVEILSGVGPGDQVIDSPPDSIIAGELVQPEQEKNAITRDTEPAPATPPGDGQQKSAR